MPWQAITPALLAVLLTGLVAALTGPVLRWLPVPPDEPDARPYAELLSPGFRITVAAATLATGLIAFYLTDPRLWLAWSALVLTGPLLGLIDGRTGLLPLRLNYVGLGIAIAGAGLAAWLSADPSILLWAAVGGVGCFCLFWLIWYFSGGQLGFGDVRLAAVLGVITGATSMPLLLWAFLIGSLVGMVWSLIAARGRGIPYGPSMLIGPPLALIVGQFIGFL
ncbi:leader peptidase (prepilin peptidase)/N-methyltransferase [Propionicimonas paludicola]|uniref:Leader peptidase (Prepilin peptidase)/N-methyltransferase n=1 Tax=Propionicimonas paludicola TaxID=185243 RepID=A0A2A9CU25_9ACTN|nr:prepilin peptidase [Propionicimonas paludicola]PFG17575.1 leader peptidase (prepilin peptidase)/N-methyltransferase [Propionicimonas paludicola]